MYRVDNMASNTVKIYWFNLALTGISSCISIFGGFVIVFTYIRIKQIRNFTRTLLLYLTIADLMTASGNLVATIRYVVVHDSSSEDENWTTNCSRIIHEVKHHNVCTGQSFVTTFSNLASFFWTLFIAAHIWFSVVTKSRKTEVTCTHIIFHVISWGVPYYYNTLYNVFHKGIPLVSGGAFQKRFGNMFGRIIQGGLPHRTGTSGYYIKWWLMKRLMGKIFEIILILWIIYVSEFAMTGTSVTALSLHVTIVIYFLVMGYLGEDTCYGTGVWCGIRSGLSRDLVRKLMFLGDVGWQLFCYITSTFFYLFIKFKLNLTENLRNGDKNFLMVVLVIYSLKCWGIIRFFITSYTSEETIAADTNLKNFLTFLLFMQSYGASGQAFWNFILFCVWDKEVWAKLRQMIGCRKEEEMELMKNETSRETERMIVEKHKKGSVNSYV